MENLGNSVSNLVPKSLQDIYPDTRLEKIITRLPLFGWRLGLGPLLGRYWMIITHIGRKTGELHRTNVDYFTMNGMKYVPCIFGVRTQWYRNILANPRVTIQTSDGSEQMMAVRVKDDEELLSIIDLIHSRNPALIKLYLESKGITAAREDILEHKQELIFLRFDPTSDPTPRGMEVDLAWIWPLLLLWSLIKRPCRRRR